jgi:hypothetical protein
MAKTLRELSPMTDPKSKKDKLVARLTAPMPERAQKELAACAATDRRAVALEAASIAGRSRRWRTLDATVEEMERRWRAVNQLLRDSFDALETRGQDTISAVRSLFGVEVVNPGSH